MEVREASAAYAVTATPQLAKGYKQTEVGVIPVDWDHQTFGCLYGEPSRNGIYKTSEFHGRGTRIVNMGEMFGYEFITDQDMSRVALTTRELSASGLLDGDLLFGRRSVVPAGAGKCSLVVSPLEPITFESSIIRVRLDKTEAHPRFYYYFFASPTGRSTIGTIVSGTNVKGIRATELRELKVPLPTKAEQEAIAEALSDADALIEFLEQLLAKKRHLKQGAMQELLTGKKHLPGFSGEWEVKQLGDVVEINKGELITEKTAVPGPIPVIAGGKKPAYSHNCANRMGKTITVSGSGASAGYVAYYDIPIFASDCSTIGEGTSYAVEFIYFVLLLNQGAIYKAQTGGAQPHIHPSDLRPLTISVPATKEEQTAIATLLSDMDTELAALEEKLAKAHAIKQGMMQELLTGRIRLV
jgi:type I restriction enzyme S subunit